MIKKTHCIHGHDISVYGRYANGRCKKCTANYSRINSEKIVVRVRKWQVENPEKAANNKRKWALANPESNRINSRKRYINNPKYLKNWKLSNPEKEAAYTRKWKQNNKQKVLSYVHRRRARKNKTKIEKFNAKEHENVMWNNQKGLCFYCKTPMIKWNIDHMLPLSRGGGHIRSNLCLACPSCNLHKFTKTAEEFLCQIT